MDSKPKRPLPWTLDCASDGLAGSYFDRAGYGEEKSFGHKTERRVGRHPAGKDKRGWLRQGR